MTIRRLGLMAGIVSLFLLAVNCFVCATFGHFLDLPGWLAWQFIPGILVVAFVMTFVVGYFYSGPLLRAVCTVSASWLGALNYAFFASAACWVMDGIVCLAGLPALMSTMGWFLFGLVFLVTAYGLINAAWLRVTHVVIRLRNLPRSWEGRSVALVTDLHLGNISGPRFLRRVISRLRALQPDAVFISGDMFDGSPIEAARLVVPWKGYSAPRGIFYVTGNHDEFVERSLFLDAVSPTGVQSLNNEKVSLDGLQIVGVHDSEAGQPLELRRILRRVVLDPARPSILLAHQPSNLAVAEEEGISLQLSGHTHGGQLWPWTHLVTRIYGRFAHGLNHLGRMQVYTSNGAGTWGPPLRIGTKSEIVLIRLENESSEVVE